MPDSVTIGLVSVSDRASAGIPVCINGYPAMFTFAVGAEKVINQRDWSETEKDYYLRIMDAMIERGVMPDHDPREPWFLCYSHTDEVIDQTLSVLEDAIRTAKR